MQRRWAAIYFVFFVVLAASSYSVVAMADPPPVDVDGDRYGEGSTFTRGGVEYDLSAIARQSSGGGDHGGGGGSALVANVSFVDPEVDKSETFEAGSPVEFEGTEYNVSIENESSGLVLAFVEEFDVESILEADDAVANTTVTSEGREFVRYRANDTLVPLEEYLPEPDVRRYQQGDTIQWFDDDGAANTMYDAPVTTVTESSATIEWTAPEDREVDLQEGANVTLVDGQYLVHFPSDGVLVLSQDYETYQEQQQLQSDFHERENGFWGIIYISGLAAVLVLGMAYMPVRG